MVAVVSVISVVLGAGVAYFAERFPAHVEALETSAGVLLIGGLALMGTGLPAHALHLVAGCPARIYPKRPFAGSSKCLHGCLHETKLAPMPNHFSLF